MVVLCNLQLTGCMTVMLQYTYVYLICDTFGDFKGGE